MQAKIFPKRLGLDFKKLTNYQNMCSEEATQRANCHNGRQPKEIKISSEYLKMKYEVYQYEVNLTSEKFDTLLRDMAARVLV